MVTVDMNIKTAEGVTKNLQNGDMRAAMFGLTTA